MEPENLPVVQVCNFTGGDVRLTWDGMDLLAVKVRAYKDCVLAVRVGELRD